MFSWLWRLFFGRGASDYLTYSPRQRMIYRHCVGFTADREPVMVSKDPMVLWRRMSAQGAELNVNMRVAVSPSKGAAECHKKLMAQVRDIFEVKSFEEGGLTELELSQLLDHFLTFIAEVKKKAQNSTTNSGGPSPTSEASTEGGPATPNGSPSGSTGTDPSTAPPTPSASAPASPTGPSGQASTSTAP